MLYNIVLVSAIHQHESATGIHVSPPLEAPSHLRRLSQSPKVSGFPLATLHIVVYMFPRYSLHTSTLSFPYYVRKSVLYVCTSIAALQIDSSVPSF